MQVLVAIVLGALMPMLGANRFLGVYAASILTGAAAWSAVNWHIGGFLVGATAGVFGLFTVFACFYPHQPITLLLFFVLPVTLKPKHIAIASLLASLAGCIFYEIMGVPSPFGFAHSAHLGGMAIGFVLIQYWRGKLPIRPRRILMR